LITLIHGPEELLRAEVLAKIRSGIAEDPALVDMNTTQFAGREVTVSALQNACDTLPFLSARRFVLVEGLLGHLTAATKRPPPASEKPQSGESAPDDDLSPQVSRARTTALLAYLDQVPETAELVFLETDVVASAVVLRHLQELQRDGRARIISCQKLKKGDLPTWIRERARLHALRLEPTAIADLAEFVGDDLRQLDQELIKLADYASDGKTVSRTDVRQLVPITRAANIFELVDALGSGDGRTAGRLMQHALDTDGEQPLRLMGMITRQYRLLIQAKALQAEGVKPAEIGRTLNVPDWTVPKLATQASRHSFDQLQTAMERILATDEAIKTGKMGDREAMDILLAQLLESQAE
jgi:DNA polymerase-3 subunit delta